MYELRLASKSNVRNIHRVVVFIIDSFSEIFNCTEAGVGMFSVAIDLFCVLFTSCSVHVDVVFNS